MPALKPPVACSHCRGAGRLRAGSAILPCPFCYVPRCTACFDSGLVEKAGRMTACTDCRDLGTDDDALVDHAIDRVEHERASVFGGARVDWSFTP
jgi:DnaJ-class molecular chaperone